VQFDDSDRADESQVEDRRGARFPGGRVGAGVGGLGLVGGAIYLALQLLASGGNQTAGEIKRIIEQGQRRVEVDPETPHSRLPAGPSGSCRGVDSKNDPAKFVVCVESNVQAFWRRELSGRGSGYHPSKLVLFSDATYSGCGTASAETGPFYCPPDEKVYLDLGFFRELQRRFHARGGDFAEAYVIALSETAFLLRGKAGWQLRWFTPTVEVDLCGHATLAAAHILWEVGRLESASAARFFTRSGELTAWKREEWIELDFPADVERPSSPNGDLEKALGGRPVHRVDGKFDHLVEFGSEAEVRALAPDMAGLARLPGRGVIATARAEPGSEFDFVSRFFAPAVGISEDPVTGSAHCLLAPYWGKRLGKTIMVGFQCSSRGGMVRVRVAGARTILGGQAVTVAVGEIVSDVAAAPRL